MLLISAVVALQLLSLQMKLLSVLGCYLYATEDRTITCNV